MFILCDCSKEQALFFWYWPWIDLCLHDFSIEIVLRRFTIIEVIKFGAVMHSVLSEIISCFDGYLAIVLRSYASFYCSIISSSWAWLSYATFDALNLSRYLVEHLLQILAIHSSDHLTRNFLLVAMSFKCFAKAI